ncbi:GMP reductase [bacterium]|nr:GMP reductase [bacterium]|tara:strand:+ start:1567 stop:2706 length:1140 start_codon:yes stop_codon:yes gene_type:complete
MRIEEDIKLDYKDVLIRPKRSTLKSRKQVKLHRSFTFRNYVAEFPEQDVTEHYNGVPIMASNMDGVGTFEMADALASQNIFTCLVKTYSADELIEFFDTDDYLRTNYVAMSIGTSDDDWGKLQSVMAMADGNLKFVCMDIANGYSDHFAQHIRKVREAFPNLVIIAGNVVTREMTEELILSGADIVKVGIGPGSVCTTRIQTGVGYPQLSAVIECADAAHGLGGHIIADGGCTCPGDVAKAFAGGADFVMLGGMLAGHDQGGGEIIEKFYATNELEYEVGEHLDNRKQKVERKQFVQFYGMSSDAANTKHFGGLKDYRSSEGREVLVPYRGSVSDTVQDLLGGIRSTCTYAGAKKLKQLSKCTTFVRCTQQFNSVYANK